MKCVVLFSSLLLLGAVSATPLTHRWVLTPDSQGNVHLLDLNSIEDNVEAAFVPANDVVFTLFTRLNPTIGQVINFNEASIRNSNFNAAHPTRVTVHGWQGQPGDPINVLVNAAYFRHGDYNMITVDWAAGSSTPNYITARNRIRDVGTLVANLIDFLHELSFVRFADLHVIGYSLGGQLVGHVGKAVTRGRVQVIKSLDPAGPLFSLDNPGERLASTDAVYVEIIHTNAGLQGFREPIGHASFYPNFGRSQPGCGADISGSCAHARAVLFYAESINAVFTAQECQSFDDIDNLRCTPTGRTASMGGAASNVGLTGVFFLTTNAESPFSRG